MDNVEEASTKHKKLDPMNMACHYCHNKIDLTKEKIWLRNGEPVHRTCQEIVEKGGPVVK